MTTYSSHNIKRSWLGIFAIFLVNISHCRSEAVINLWISLEDGTTLEIVFIRASDDETGAPLDAIGEDSDIVESGCNSLALFTIFNFLDIF